MNIKLNVYYGYKTLSKQETEKKIQYAITFGKAGKASKILRKKLTIYYGT